MKGISELRKCVMEKPACRDYYMGGGGRMVALPLYRGGEESPDTAEQGTS